MAGPKVEMGDDVATYHGSELMVRQEDLEGAMNSMKQHAPIWNGVKAGSFNAVLHSNLRLKHRTPLFGQLFGQRR